MSKFTLNSQAGGEIRVTYFGHSDHLILGQDCIIISDIIVLQLKLLPEPPSLSKEPIVLQLRELNPYITCGLCGGYLYEASTITECMHTCKSLVTSDGQSV
jgi:hypothetical protein